MNEAFADIEEHFRTASSLEPRERTRYLEELRRRDRELADELAELLAADASGSGRVPDNPPPTQAQAAARNAMQGRRESAELDPASREVLDRLSSRTNAQGRYSLRGEVGRGGMGAVLEVWDEDLKRRLAMKVALGESSVTGPRSLDSITLARFLEEAQVTGQLDHPGIVPVHELGLDQEGRVFFTMRLVRGRPLDEIFELARERKEGWNLVRALGVLLKVCEAMAYAHSKGVIHRDLKPANIMVGRFGEVYVMDWGVAHVLGSEAEPPREGSLAITLTSVRTSRASGRGETHEDPLITREGTVLGTPYYMPPEQAGGRYDQVDARADVYAVGAMLYQLLAGRMPYHRPGQHPNPHTVLAMVLQGPPPPVLELEPRAPAELVAICEKAMARHPNDRYTGMLALSEDLQAYLEDRVVRAYATGPLVELRKWIVRNRAWAAAGFLALLLVLAGGVASFLQAERLQAEQEARDYRLFLKYAQLEESALRVDSSEMWPATPDRIAVYDAWLEAVDEYLRGAEEVRRKLEARRAGGTMMRFPSPDSMQIRRLAERAGRSVDEGVPSAVRESLEVWNFADPENRWLHDQTARLVRTIERFLDPVQGLIEGCSPEHGWGIARRRAWAARVHELTVSGMDASTRWGEAIGSIAASRRYAGLILEPQLGLLPLGADPESDLWEFALLQTGTAPGRDEVVGDLVLEEDTALILVLIPGGTFAMGAQRFDRFGPNYDPQAEPDEEPVHDVTLTPFFLSKYEMNQAQWNRIAGEDPSVNKGEPWFPVERVSWEDCTRVLGWLGCTLPTEAQWEYAARAGTSTPWWTGNTVASLQDRSNIADASVGKTALDRPYEQEVDDDSPYMAPANAFLPNPFGLYGVHGNVWEWCLDEYGAYVEEPQDDPLSPPLGKEIIGRGGSYANRAAFTRCANRSRFTPDFIGQRLGVRPAKRIEGEIRYMR